MKLMIIDVAEFVGMQFISVKAYEYPNAYWAIERGKWVADATGSRYQIKAIGWPRMIIGKRYNHAFDQVVELLLSEPLVGQALELLP